MIQNVESYNKSIRLLDKQNIEKSNKWNKTITISLEIEQCVPELLDLLPYVDLVFISKDFARSRGYNNMDETLKNISVKAKPGYRK